MSDDKSNDRPGEGFIATFAAQLAEALRAGLDRDLPEDLSERLQPMLASTLKRLQLVPQAEFERQLVLLERLEQSARRLEARVAELESARRSDDSSG